MNGTVTKPAIGLRPKWAWEETVYRDRVIEIAEAIDRYKTADQGIPMDWLQELDDLFETEAMKRYAECAPGKSPLYVAEFFRKLRSIDGRINKE